MEDKIEKQILTAAMQEFQEKGYKGSSMRSVAERAGIAVGTIYNYINGKDNLFRLAMLETWKKLKEEIQQVDFGESLRIKFKRIGLLQLEYMDYFQEVWYELTRLGGRSKTNTLEERLYNEAFEDYIALLSEFLKNARLKGEIKPHFTMLTEETLASMFVSLINSLKFSLTDDSPEINFIYGESVEVPVNPRLTKALEETLEIFFNGLGQI